MPTKRGNTDRALKRSDAMLPIRLLVGLLVAIVLCHLPIAAQINDGLPEDVKDLKVEEKLNTQVDLNLSFYNEAGQSVTLREYFKSGRPVVLTMAYYSCPMLCGMVIKGVTNSLRDVEWTPGKEFEVINVSFDPRETYQLANAKKEAVLVDYGRLQAREGWHFLADKDGNAKKLAAQMGFKYRWIEDQKQFAHGSVAFVLTPEGKISRYLYGLSYAPRDMKLALAEASEGKVGDWTTKLLLYCYHYDPQARSYVLTAKTIMRIGGLVVLSLVALGLVIFWRREMRGEGGSRWSNPPDVTTQPQS